MKRISAAMSKFARGVRNQIEGSTELHRKLQAFAGQSETAPRFLHQFRADRVLEVLNVARHHRVRDRQVIGCRANGAHACECLEGPRGKQIWHGATHRKLLTYTASFRKPLWCIWGTNARYSSCLSDHPGLL